MKAGRLSYTVDGAGQRRIDTSELDRVFGISTGSGGRSPSGSSGGLTVLAASPFSSRSGRKLSEPIGSNGASGASACEALQSNTAHAGEHAALERLLADREASIADLRRRLDASEAERRQLSERLHGLLTNRSNDMTGLRENSFATQEFPPGEPKPLRDATVSESRHGTEPSASSGLAIARPPWWRRWFR
jgi:hypothetical protein